MKIIFVCTGNTCRSPLAESIAKSLAANSDYLFESRGIAAFDGTPVSLHSAEIIDRHQLVPVGSAQLFEAADSSADLILTMSYRHKQYILDQYPEAKVYTLKEYTDSSGEISDPYGGSSAVYERAYMEIRQSVEKLLEKLDNSQ